MGNNQYHSISAVFSVAGETHCHKFDVETCTSLMHAVLIVRPKVQ